MRSWYAGAGRLGDRGPRIEGWCDHRDGRETKLMLVDDFGVWGDLIYACGGGGSGLRFWARLSIIRGPLQMAECE